MIRFRTNYRGEPYKVRDTLDYDTVLTVPHQAQTIQDIINAHVSGASLDGLSREGYYDSAQLASVPRTQDVDLVDIHRAMEVLRERERATTAPSVREEPATSEQVAPLKSARPNEESTEPQE